MHDIMCITINTHSVSQESYILRLAVPGLLLLPQLLLLHLSNQVSLYLPPLLTPLLLLRSILGHSLADLKLIQLVLELINFLLSQ